MDAVRRTVETQIQFWSLLGPSLVLISVALLLFKVSPHWYIPLGALMGLPLCVKWNMKGMAAALGCLLVLTGIGYQNLELGERYWHVGLSLAVAFSFIVLTLSLEEARGLVHQLQLESQSRLENFALLDERWKVSEEAWRSEREQVEAAAAESARELGRAREEKQTFYKLAQLARDELAQVRVHHEHLLQDLVYKKEQIAQLREQVEGMEMTIQELVNADAQKQLFSLNERLSAEEGERKALQETNGSLELKLKAVQEQLCAAERRLESSNRREGASSCAEGEKARSLEALHRELRGQFEEKSAALDAVRRELFRAHEALLAEQKEREEERLMDRSETGRALEEALVELERCQEEIRELTEWVDDLL